MPNNKCERYVVQHTCLSNKILSNYPNTASTSNARRSWTKLKGGNLPFNRCLKINACAVWIV